MKPLRISGLGLGDSLLDEAAIACGTYCALGRAHGILLHAHRVRTLLVGSRFRRPSDLSSPGREEAVRRQLRFKTVVAGKRMRSHVLLVKPGHPLAGGVFAQVVESARDAWVVHNFGLV